MRNIIWTSLLVLFLNCYSYSAKLRIGIKDIAKAVDFIKEDLPPFKREISEDCKQGLGLIQNGLYNTVFFFLLNSLYPGQWSDYGTCLDDLNGQYVLATITGSFQGNYVFSRGVRGKFFDNLSSVVGLCIPKTCTKDDVSTLTPNLIETMEGLNWTNVNIDYTMSSQFAASGIQANVSDSMNTFTWLLILFFVILGTVGMVFELSKLGDIVGLDYEILNPQSKFLRVRSYDRILLQRKKGWAQAMLCFSTIRNFLYYSIPYQPLRIAEREERTKHLTQNLKVFDGLKGFGILFVLFCLNYQFSWYAGFTNQQDIQGMRDGFFFTIIGGGWMIASMFFFIGGFLQTFSFMQNGDKMFDLYHMSRYFGKKVVRFMPFNIFIMLFAMFIVPYQGLGPIWINYVNYIKPCNTLWWTNIVYVNNLYPANYDDKCLPWSWFLPTYVQLSLLTPFLVLFYKQSSRQIFMIGTFVIFLLFSIGNLFLAVDKDLGATPFMNEEFLAYIFMKPWYHFNSFFMGALSCIIYKEILENVTSLDQRDQQGILSRTFKGLYENNLTRYMIYLGGFLIMGLAYMGQYPWVSDNLAYSKIVRALFSTFAPQVFLIGLLMLLMPTLLGKALFIRAFFCGNFWTFFSHHSFGLGLTMPVVALYFYLGNFSHAVHLDYQTMFYNFAGLCIFALGTNLLVYNAIDRPCYHLYTIKKDAQLAKADKQCEVEQFLLNVKNKFVKRVKNSPLAQQLQGQN